MALPSARTSPTSRNVDSFRGPLETYQAESDIKPQCQSAARRVVGETPLAPALLSARCSQPTTCLVDRSLRRFEPCHVPRRGVTTLRLQAHQSDEPGAAKG